MPFARFRSSEFAVPSSKLTVFFLVVWQHALQLAGVGRHHGGLGVHAQLDLGPPQILDLLADSLGELRQRDARRYHAIEARLDATDPEHAVDQVEEVDRAVVHALDQRALLLVERAAGVVEQHRVVADQHVQRAKRTNVPLDEYYRNAQKEIPIGRIGKAEEFANLACFLVSDAGSYITGTATNVDGGRSPVV